MKSKRSRIIAVLNGVAIIAASIGLFVGITNIFQKTIFEKLRVISPETEFRVRQLEDSFVDLVRRVRALDEGNSIIQKQIADLE